MNPSPPSPLFGRRMGRPLTTLKKDLLEQQLPILSFALPEEGHLHLNRLFPQKGPLYLEIGFGTGHHLLAQILGNPEKNFIGCEPYMGGIAAFLKKASSHSLDNNRLKLYTKDGQSLLRALPTNSCAHVFVLFPDPWPKKRHLKRRFLDEITLREISRVLQNDGCFTFASDIEDYFEKVLALCNSLDTLTLNIQDILINTKDPRKRPNHWPLTRFEEKAHREGRVCNFAQFIKRKLT